MIVENAVLPFMPLRHEAHPNKRIDTHHMVDGYPSPYVDWPQPGGALRCEFSYAAHRRCRFQCGSLSPYLWICLFFGFK